MPKKTRKQSPENSQGENSENRILQIIHRHADDITKAKDHYLKEENSEQYLIYSNIESAFDILKEDLNKEGFEL